MSEFANASMRRLGLVVGALALAAAIATSAKAEVVHGGAGGAPYKVSCGTRFLVGLAGTAGDALERLAPICARLDPMGRWVGAPFTLDAVGGSSGEAIMFRTTCPRDTVVEGWKGYSGQYMYHVSLLCRRHEPDGTTTRVSAAPRTVGGQQHTFVGEGYTCGPNRAANGIIGRAGDIIDAFGITCGGILVGLPQEVPEPVTPPLFEDGGVILQNPRLDENAAKVLTKPDAILQAPADVGVLKRLPDAVVTQPVDGFEAPREVELPTEFRNPEVNGLAVDYCLTWGQNCGKPAADAFCRKQGFARSEGHQVYNNAPPTIVIGDGAICREPYCARMISISCSR